MQICVKIWTQYGLKLIVTQYAKICTKICKICRSPYLAYFACIWTPHTAALRLAAAATGPAIILIFIIKCFYIPKTESDWTWNEASNRIARLGVQWVLVRLAQARRRRTGVWIMSLLTLPVALARAVQVSGFWRGPGRLSRGCRGVTVSACPAYALSHWQSTDSARDSESDSESQAARASAWQDGREVRSKLCNISKQSRTATAVASAHTHD